MAEFALLNQGKKFFGKLTKTQKILFGSVIGAMLIGTVSLFFLLGEKPEYGVLYSELEPSDASKIVEQLKEKKLPYKLENNGSTILVEKPSVYETRIDLAGKGLPESGTVGYELFDKTNIGMSEFVQKLNYRRALEGELAKTIKSIDEVKNARVHLVIPEKTLFKKDQKEPTASVTLHLKSGRSLSNISMEGIQNLVASSVEGMKTGAVTIVDQHGKIISQAPLDENSVAGLTEAQYDQQNKVEQSLAHKVQTLLDGVLGADNSQVKVNTELDFTRIESTVTDYDPDKQVVRSEQNITEKSASTDSLSYPTVSQQKDQSNSIANYEISKKEEHIINGVGAIKRMSVSVLVNGTSKIADKNGKKVIQYIPRTKEEMDQLTLAVKNAVGYDPSRNDQISVLNVPFDNSMLEEELEKSQPIPWQQDPEIRNLIILVAAMLLTIFIMYRILHSKHVKERMRIAMSLPAKVTIDRDLIPEEEEAGEEEEMEEGLEDLQLDEEDLLLLPAELPEQLLLEGQMPLEEEEAVELGEGERFDKGILADRAKAALEESESPELTEETMMKLEMKNKVEGYLDDSTEDAVRLIRVFLAQDFDSLRL